ncbi:MAG: hypothetical protein ABI648_13525 [Betaproteobacteria bacterium]
MADPRDGRTLLMAAKTGHLGPTVFRLHAGGRTWAQAKQPLVFKEAAPGEEGRSVEAVFWVTAAPDSEPGVCYAGTSPPGLLRSLDDGKTWSEVAGFNDMLYPCIRYAIVPGPHGAQVHSICVDPADSRHLYVGISIGNWPPAMK